MKMVVGRRTFPFEIDPFEGRCYFFGVCVYPIKLQSALLSRCYGHGSKWEGTQVAMEQLQMR